jgi:hypothetical protein
MLKVVIIKVMPKDIVDPMVVPDEHLIDFFFYMRTTFF